MGEAKVEIQKKIYQPFTAGRMKTPDGKHRADAFGFVIPSDEPLPKIGSKIEVKIIDFFSVYATRLFTVKAVETMNLLGVEGKTRCPEVYVLIQEHLKDQDILNIKKFGAQVHVAAQEAFSPLGKETK